MPRFDINSYDPVDARLEKFWAEHPNGAITTELLSDPNDAKITLFKASVYFDVSGGSSFTQIPNGVGHAQGWKDGPGMADGTSWLEVAETSAIGRALADCGYKAKKDSERPSQEEMVNAGAFNRPAQSNYQRTESTSVGEVFEERFARNTKQVDLVAYAAREGFKGSNTRALKSEVEQTFGVQIKGNAPDGGCLPADVANAIAYYSGKLDADTVGALPTGRAEPADDEVPF